MTKTSGRWSKYKTILPEPKRFRDTTETDRELRFTECPHCGRTFAGNNYLCLGCKKPTGIIPEMTNRKRQQEDSMISEHIDSKIMHQDDDDNEGGLGGLLHHAKAGDTSGKIKAEVAA